MGISVSYTGSDGRHQTSELDGLPTAGSELDRLIRGTSVAPPPTGRFVNRHRMQAMPDPDRGKVKSGEADNLEFLKEKLLPGGSLDMTTDGKLCLKGETNRMPVTSPKFFTTKDGSAKYRSIREMDSVESPRDIGGPSLSASEEPDETSKDLNEEYAVRFSVCTRHVGKLVQPASGPAMVTIYEYTRELRYSRFGLLAGVGPERRRVVINFLCNAKDQNGSTVAAGKYEIRPFWASNVVGESDINRLHPMLGWFALGTGDDLDTWDGTKFTCNYDEATGSLLPDPPVKIINTDNCSYTPT